MCAHSSTSTLFAIQVIYPTFVYPWLYKLSHCHAGVTPYGCMSIHSSTSLPFAIKDLYSFPPTLSYSNPTFVDPATSLPFAIKDLYSFPLVLQ